MRPYIEYLSKNKIIKEIIDNFETTYDETSISYSSRLYILRFICQILVTLNKSKCEDIVDQYDEYNIILQISVLLRTNATTELYLELLKLLQSMIPTCIAKDPIQKINIREDIENLKEKGANQEVNYLGNDGLEMISDEEESFESISSE